MQNITTVFNRGTVDEVTLFDEFNFTVNSGDFVSVVGSNGSGKTTLLNLICGSLRPDGGKILLDGKDLTHVEEYKRARIIGRVFQDPKMGTCSNLTVIENFALADRKNKRFGLGTAVKKERLDYYRTLLADCRMGLEDRMNIPVGALSGGQRQAIALVIAGMTKVQLLILDEHTAALDPKSSETIMELTDRLVQENGLTTVMVTHNLRHACQYGTRLVMMDKGHIVMERGGEEKQNTRVEDILSVFNQISIECGN